MSNSQTGSQQTTAVKPTAKYSYRIALLLTLVVTTIYLSTMGNQGWIAHDEGLLAHSADRILAGETPHIDFQDPYTGGLSYWHAQVFNVLGTSLTSLRTILVGVAILAVIAWFMITARFLPPASATVVTLVCLVWSFPNYFAALPSWYNLMFSSWAMWAILKYSDELKPRFLVLATCAIGLSILCKITGVYALAATFFAVFFIHLNQDPAMDVSAKHSKYNSWQLMIGAGLLGVTYCTLLFLLVDGRVSISNLALFCIPGTILMVVVFWQSQIAKTHSTSVSQLGLHTLLIIAIIHVVLIVFCYGYFDRGAMTELLQGVIILPTARLAGATFSPPSPHWLLLTIPLGLLIYYDRRLLKTAKVPLVIIVAMVGTILIALGGIPLVYRIAFQSGHLLLPVIVTVGSTILIKSRTDFVSKAIRNRLFILLMFAAALSLMQYPYSSGIYFCYTSPFLILAVAAIVTRTKKYDRHLWGSVAALVGIFAVVWINFSNPRTVGVFHQQANEMVTLDLPRGGITIPAIGYDEIKPTIDYLQQHSQANEYILAGPDCPQFYFLANRKNPTPQFYDLFQASVIRGWRGKGYITTVEQELKKAIENRDIKLVVINTIPEFSQPYSGEFIDWLKQWGQRITLDGPRRYIIYKRN
ncbi:MAG: hypothetical protein HOB73_02420 [Planctomycetaceae bacterium]|nr:hypothetical protein [Planctomycetaceae bacterium]